MKFTTVNFNGEDVRVSLEAETNAEECQLKALCDKLFDEGAHFLNWNDREGGHGICLVVEIMPLHSAKLCGAMDFELPK